MKKETKNSIKTLSDDVTIIPTELRDTIWSTPKEIYSLSKCRGKGRCPFCSSKLFSNGITYIPMKNPGELARIKGQVCHNCKKIFVIDSEINNIKSFLTDNKRAQDFLLDGKNDFYDCSDRIERDKQEVFRKHDKKFLEKIEDAIMMIYATDKDKHNLRFIITSSEETEDIDRKIYCYKNRVARDLLAATFELNEIFIFQGCEYAVTDWIYKKDSQKIFEKQIKVSSLYLIANGGYYSPSRGSHCEDVVALLYSPYKKTYECIQATYDRAEGICFTDCSLYRDFLYKNGRPPIDIMYNIFNHGRFSLDKLSPESILKIWGYNVSQAEDLSSEERQKILADVVDSETMNTNEVINHLTWCIDFHRRYKIACSKWKEDKEFLKNYKFNPERFLIVKEERPKKKK